LKKKKKVTKIAESVYGLGYGLHDRRIGVRFSVEAGNLSLLHIVQTCSGAHSASCPLSMVGLFSSGRGVKLPTHL
jgi:hypothetical protein